MVLRTHIIIQGYRSDGGDAAALWDTSNRDFIAQL